MSAKKKRKCGGKRTRAKGAIFERWITKQLQDAELDAKRAGSAQASINIVLPDVLLDGWWTEAKQGKKNYIDPKKALEQAERDRDGHGNGETPVAITRVDGERQAWCHMRLGDLMDRSTTYVAMSNVPNDIIVTIRFEDWVEIVKAGSST